MLMLFAVIKSMLKSDEDEPSLEALADEELMVLYSQGEVRAFELLMKRHERPLYNFILRSCKRADVAEELLQEVFMRVIKSAGKYEKKAKFTTWVYTIARHLCIDRARKKSRGNELSLDQTIGGDEEGGQSFGDLLVDTGADVSHMSYERKMFLKRLEHALAQLPEDQREVFLLKEVSGLKFREIAECVGAPVPTIKSRMRYALQALRGHLVEYKEVRFDEEERKEVVRSND